MLVSAKPMSHPSDHLFRLAGGGKKSPPQVEEWCWVHRLASTGSQGYVQVSIGGANKFALLHQLSAIAFTGRGVSSLQGAEQASHLCHHGRCWRPGHVIIESAALNTARQGCQVWQLLPEDVPGEPRRLRTCVHEPACIRAIPNVTADQFFANPNGFVRGYVPVAPLAQQ